MQTEKFGTPVRWIAHAAALLALTTGACKSETEPDTAPPVKGHLAEQADPAEEMRAVAKKFMDAYTSLGGGDVEGGVQAFPEHVTWTRTGGGDATLTGREELAQRFRTSRSSRELSLERVFVTDEELLVGQGVLSESGLTAGFVTVARVDGDEISEVREFVAAGLEGAKRPPVPDSTDLIDEYASGVNQATADSLLVAWTKRDWQTIEGMIDANVVHHEMARGSTTTGFEDYKKGFEYLGSAFPDLSFSRENSWAVDEYVILESTVRGTHTAPLGDIAPTEKSFDMTTFTILRFEGGSVVEIWNYHDARGFMDQLGNPTPGAKDKKKKKKKKKR